jgi:hypothetical protein
MKEEKTKFTEPERLTAAESEAFRRKILQAQRERQGKDPAQVAYSERVAGACVIGFLLALLFACLLFSGCSSQKAAYRGLYRHQLKTTKRAQNAHLLNPKTKHKPY